MIGVRVNDFCVFVCMFVNLFDCVCMMMPLLSVLSVAVVVCALLLPLYVCMFGDVVISRGGVPVLLV